MLKIVELIKLISANVKSPTDLGIQEVALHQTTESKCFSECGLFVYNQNRYILINWWNCFFGQVIIFICLFAPSICLISDRSSCLHVEFLVCSYISKIHWHCGWTRWKTKYDLYLKRELRSETEHYSFTAVNVHFTALHCRLPQSGTPSTQTSMFFWFVGFLCRGSMCHCSLLPLV